MPRRMRCAEATSPYPLAATDPPRRPQHRAVHRRGFCRGLAGMPPRTRSSSSACRAPDRPWSSRSSRRTAWSKAPASFPTCRRSRRGERHYPAVSAVEMTDADARRGARRGISQAHGGSAPYRAALLHRQIAQQLDVRAVHPVGPAQREDHRRAAPSARLLLLELPPAFRARPGVQPTTSPTRPILSRLCAADGACRRGAARARPPSDLRAHGRRHRSRGARAARRIAGWSSNRRASNSTRPNGRSERQAPSRCASRSIATRPRNGGATTHSSVRCATRSARSSIAIPTCRSRFDTYLKKSTEARRWPVDASLICLQHRRQDKTGVL